MKSDLERLHILGLPAFRAFDHIELYLLTFLQAAESTRLNSREVYEYILTVLAADKSIAFGVIEPLYCSCFHGVALFLFVDVALNNSLDFCRQVTRERRNCELQKTLQDQTRLYFSLLSRRNATKIVQFGHKGNELSGLGLVQVGVD